MTPVRNNKGQKFRTIKDAANAAGVNRSGIEQAIRLGCKAGGSRWFTISKPVAAPSPIPMGADAFAAGYDAFAAGFVRDANPMGKPADRRLWFLGWDDAAGKYDAVEVIAEQFDKEQTCVP